MLSTKDWDAYHRVYLEKEELMSILEQCHLNSRRHYSPQMKVHILRIQKSALLKLNI